MARADRSAPSLHNPLAGDRDRNGERLLRRHVSALTRTSSVFVAVVGLALCSGVTSATAAVSAPVFADVTSRGFSVVWASDEAVAAATVKVFADPAGTVELTSGLGVGSPSAGSSAALAVGVVRVKVSGLTSQTCVFVQTETTGSATVLDPLAAPFPQVCTASVPSRQTPTSDPILNDLVSHDVLTPDQAGAADGALLLVSLPGVSPHPLSAFVGEGFAAPAAVVDLNNVVDATTDTNAEVNGGDLLAVVEFRGLHCPSLLDHALLRFRRAPDHAEVGQIGVRLIDVKPATACFAADTVCDDVIDILDLQHTLNALGTAAGDCLYNRDLDLDASGGVDSIDVQGVIDEFGASAPFPGP